MQLQAMLFKCADSNNQIDVIESQIAVLCDAA